MVEHARGEPPCASRACGPAARGAARGTGRRPRRIVSRSPTALLTFVSAIRLPQLRLGLPAWSVRRAHRRCAYGPIFRLICWPLFCASGRRTSHGQRCRCGCRGSRCHTSDAAASSVFPFGRDRSAEPKGACRRVAPIACAARRGSNLGATPPGPLQRSRGALPRSTLRPGSVGVQTWALVGGPCRPGLRTHTRSTRAARSA